MKGPTEAVKKNKDHILLQSFGVADNQTSNYSSRVRPKAKVSEFNSPPQSSQCESNFKLVCNTSRKILQTQEKSIQSHYENMQKILFTENLNLKQQNAFLTSQIRKKMKHEHRYKQERKKIAAQMNKNENQIRAIKEELFNSSSFIENQLYYLAQGLQSSNLQEIKNIIMRTLDSISSHFQIEFEKILPRSNVENTSIDRPYEQQESKNQVEYEIERLSKKLQKLLEEDHSANKGPLIRRQCIEISKQIKQLKDKSRSMTSQSAVNESIPNNNYQYPRSSLRSSKQISKNQLQKIKRATWQNDLVKEQSQQLKRYQPEIYSKISHRRSLSKQQSPGGQADSPMFYNTAERKSFK